jgi:glyoxylase-like metal-dependent hydrolase (beta-lactamase superfamily II)
MTWSSPEKENFERAQIISELARRPGDHVVIVHYAPDHILSNEWVYNRADIDHSKVVWARDMGPEKNAELIQYFHGREAWVVQPDISPMQLQRYTDKQ